MAKPRRLMNEINVVPYIDVMLVLLVIFMVTAPLLPSGSIDLPSVGSASQIKQTPIEILIHSERKLAIRERNRERTLQFEELIDTIHAIHQTEPDRPILIAADKSVRYEAVMKVMDALQSAHITKIGLMVQTR